MVILTCVLILPPDVFLNPPSQVWVQVQWLYSPDDVLAPRANEIKVKPKEP